MSLPDTFKAAQLNEKGAKHSISERSLGELQPDEVAIKITATAINPVDWKVRDSGYFLKEYPAILGSDASGQIVAVGNNVTHLPLGQRVFFQGIIGNYDASTFQEYCKMPAALVGKAPGSVNDEEAAGISLATVAVVTAFYDKSGRGLSAPWDQDGDEAGKGKAIVIIGGSSSVGQYAIQMARLSGYERIITNSSMAHEENLKRLGAHVVLDRSKASPKDFVSALEGVELDFVFDSISYRDTQTLGVQILQEAEVESSVVTVQAVDSEAKSLGESKKPKVDVRQVMGLGSSPDLRYLSEPLMKNLGGDEGWLALGKFFANKPVVVDGGLDKIDEALDKNRAGVSGEKVVINP
ncbi:zinc-binding alcohol dehydrogenase family protein [Aspergillus stella-maris]|uniref:zinc-binding alcohol dehydrogenase family protein n=1 Tax=Aspergillus stella-maris TaxID=1810926 RepID=UPI003CCD2299